MKYELSVKDFVTESCAGNIDIEDFTSKVIDEVKKLNKKLNCFITISDEAIEDAKNIKKNLNGKLMGLPISVKDCICTKDILTTAGSKILNNYIPEFDATIIKKIKDSNGIIIGKTCQDEFGFGTFSTNCAYGIPKNPYDESRSCGGSSGGAACITTSLKFPHIALAESTGGSISCPACFCGAVGLTPTYGLVSRYGLIDYANSLDKIGIIGKMVWDTAFMLSLISGNDPMDQTSLNEKQKNYTDCLDKDIKKIKIGIPIEYFENIDQNIENKIWNIIKKLEDLGYEYEKISLPTTKYSIASYYIIACSEASTNLAKYCGIRYGMEKELVGNFNEYFSNVRGNYFGKEAKKRIILGTFARMSGYRNKYYLKSLKIRNLIINDFKKAFKKFDVLISPTMPILPPKFSDIEKLNSLENYMTDILTVGPNLAGIPMLSIPAGFVNGLPIGMHILGDHMQEEKILNIGNKLEKLIIK